MTQVSLHKAQDIHFGALPPGVLPLVGVKAHLRALVARALEAKASQPLQGCFHTLLALESALLSDFLDPAEADALLAAPDMAESVVASQQLFSAFELELERSLIATYQRMPDKRSFLRDDPDITYNYLLRYHHLTRDEEALARLTPSDQVAFVGAGPFPISAIGYVRAAGCKVHGIEIVERAAVQARGVLADLGFTDRVRIHHGAGQDFCFAGYGKIIVGVLAAPKGPIMARIAATADPGAQVFCRTTHGLRRMIYAPIAPAALLPYRPVGAHQASGFQTLSTLSLRLDPSLALEA